MWYWHENIAQGSKKAQACRLKWHRSFVCIRCAPRFRSLHTARRTGHISTIMIPASVIIIVITMIHICYYFIIEGFWVKPCNYKESPEQRATCNEVLAFLPRSLIYEILENVAVSPWSLIRDWISILYLWKG